VVRGFLRVTEREGSTTRDGLPGFGLSLRDNSMILTKNTLNQEEALLSTYLPLLDLATGIFLIFSSKFLLKIFHL
jgi:hypothetical protein